MIKNKLRIAKSPFSNEWYAFRKYKDMGKGNLIVTGEKEDITIQIKGVLINFVEECVDECKKRKVKTIDIIEERYNKMFNELKEYFKNAKTKNL